MPIYADSSFRKTSMPRLQEEETGIFNEFGKGFSSGVDQLQALAGGAKALVGSAVGNDEWFYDGMEYFNEQMAEASENAAEVGSLEDIEGLGDFVNYSAFIVGNIVPSLIGGGGFGAVGGAVAKKALIQQGAKRLVKENAEGLAKNAAKRQYAQSALGRESLGKIGLRGQIAGATGFSTAMNAGESFTRIFDETGEEAAGLALVTGLASGALDAMTPMRVLKRVLPQNMYSKAAGEVAENVSKKQSVITRALKEAGKASGTEGVTEMMQEIVQNSALEFVRGQQDPAIEEAYIDRLFSEENKSQYLNAFVAGAIGGGAIGGSLGAVTKDPEAKQNLDRDDLQEETKDQSQEEPVVDSEPQEADPNIGGEKVQAARAKAQGLPEGRSTIAPMTVEQAREKAQNLPEQREPSDPVARQEEARARARALVDGLPSVRAQAKEIYQMELGALGETTRIPNQETTTTVEDAPTFGGNLPENISPRMEALVGKDVDYNGNKGPVVRKDDGFYVATQDNGDVLIESGEFQSPEQLGVVPSDGNLVFENDVQIDDNNKFELRGKKYSLTRIIRDADGNPLSLAVRDENGAKKTIRTPEVVARINNQKSPAPDFSQIIVELDDLPVSIQKQVVQQSDPDNIPDSVPASQAIDIAQSMPNAEAVVEDIQELAKQSLTIPQGTMNDMPAVPYTESVTRPAMKPLAQAIADVNKSQGANRSPIDQGRIDNLFTAPEVTMINGEKVTPADGVQANELKSALVDLLNLGMPKRVMKYFKGIYTHAPNQMDRQVDGAYLKGSQIITMNSSRIRELIADKDDTSDAAVKLRFNLVHEIGHAFDVGTGHTNNSPDFALEMDGMSSSSATYEMGPVIHELGQNYLSGTELGQELAYPFGAAFEWIANSEPQKIAGQVDRIQKEAFAQAFAVFHTSPELLQEQAPKTYKHLETLLRTQPTEINQDGEANIRSNEADRQPQEVQGDVRSPAQRGGTEVQEQEGAGGDGGGSLNEEQASQGLGDQVQREAGDGTGRTVQLEEDAAEARLVEQELGEIDDDYDPMDDLASFDDDALFIQRKDLSPEAQNITASGVLYGDEEIPVTGTSRNGATVVVDLARAFDERVREATGGNNLGEPNDANAEVVSDLIAHEAVQAMQTDGNAGEWYQQKVSNAMNLAAQEFPELTTDPNAKFAFTAIMSITSNGASVPENSINTFEIYEEYRDTKIFPDFGVGKEAQAMKSSFALLNRLIKLEGIDAVREFMDKDVTVKVLKDEFGLSVSGELMGTKLKGSAILGPKIGGGFFQNLNGNFDPLTMDRWFMRTWGRLTGTLMADAERKLPVQLAKFREVALSEDYRSKLKADGINRNQLSRDDEYAKSYAIQVQSAYANGGFKDKNSINKASNTFKNSQSEKQAPQNGKEREYIRSVMMLALDKVNRTSGSDPVNMGALQAIVWYPEKDLYKQLGVGNAKSEPTDYETEFQKIVEARSQRGSRLSGPDRSAQQSGAGRLEPADGRDEPDAGQPTSRQNQQSNAEADQLDAPPRRNPQRIKRAEALGFDTDNVFYHGTDVNFSSFSTSSRGSNTAEKDSRLGFFFSSNPEVASSYASTDLTNIDYGKGLLGAVNKMTGGLYRKLNESANNLARQAGFNVASEFNSPQVLPVYTRSNNRSVVDAKGARYDERAFSRYINDALANGADSVLIKNVIDEGFAVRNSKSSAASDVLVVFSPENIRSVNAQFDPAKAQSDDLLASPPRNPSDFVTAPTSTAAEIMSDEDLVASVRTGSDGSQAFDAVKDKDVKAAAGFAKSGFKKWFQKNFYSRGLLPETAFDAKIERDGEFGAVEMDIRQMVGLFDEAVQNNFGEIDESQAAVLDKAMQIPAAEVMASKLPNDIKEALVAMRNYIDKMSADYAEILNSDIERLKALGNEEANAKSELLSIVVNNMGKYANRSYRAFDDKNWNKTVPEKVIVDARDYLVAQGTANPDQVINTILKEGTAFDDMSSFIAESKLGAKDLSILKQRQDIAPEIRALLGEYKDARINFAKSATKMSRLIYNERFLNQVLKDGKGVFLFDQEDAPVGATKKIAEVGSKTMTPLNGLYTFPEVEQAFRDALDKEQIGGLYKTVIQINGLVKYGKTVIAPTTMARNWMSASLFTVANGHFNWSKIAKSIDVTSSYRTGQGDGIEYLKRLKKLGVVHDNPYAGEMIALLKDSNAEDWVSGSGPIKSFFDGATRFYQYGDDFWKIVGFENEIINFMENKGMSREEAEVKAAKRIRDTYPTYSLIGNIPQKLRRFPLAGTFVSFPAEIVRTQANMIKYLREDLADPDMRPAALKRIAGIGMVSAGVYAAQAMAMSAFGVSEEEEEAIKLMAAPWSKNSNILVTGRDDQGRLEYLDLTHLDPYALMKRPLNALLRDQPLDDAVLDAGVEILKPFLGWDISTNTILEFISNEKTSGGEVYNEADTFSNKAVDTYMHFERGMGPSVIQNGRRMEKALSGEISRGGKAYDVGDEMAAFIGFRKTTFDPKTALHFKAYEFSEGKRQSTRLLTSVFRDPNDVSDDDIREAFGRASTARRKTFEDMAALVSAAMSSGLNATQAMTILRSNGVTKKDAKALIEGGASAWTMSDSTLKNSISKSDVLFGKQKSKEFVDRWSLIQQLLNEEASQ